MKIRKEKISKLGIISSVILLLCSGCENRPKYEVGVKTDVDSTAVLELNIFEAPYTSVRILQGNRVEKNMRIEYSGRINSDKIAYFKFQGDSVPYHFILKNEKSEFEIKNRKLHFISGGVENERLFRTTDSINQMVEERVGYVEKYNRLVADTLLIKNEERVLLANIDSLTNSIDRMILSKTDILTPENYIIWRTSGKYLSKDTVPEKFKF